MYKITKFCNVIPPLRFTCTIWNAVICSKIDQEYPPFIEKIKAYCGPGGQVYNHNDNAEQ